jgi:putative ABC transport system permease protein
VLLLLPSRSIVISYAALFVILIGFALMVPWVVVRMAVGVRPLMGRLFGLLGRMAARGIVVALSRTAVAIAALTIAVSATIGVGVMVASFRQTVVVWLDRSLQADVYISPPGLVMRRNDATLDPELAARFRRVDGVEAAGTGRTLRVRSDVGTIDLFTFQRTRRSEASFRFKQGDPTAVWASFMREEALIVSEPLAYRYGLTVGDSLRLETDRGLHAFRIAGVFYDYGSDLGIAMMSRPTFERAFDDRSISSMVLFLEPGADPEAVIATLRRQIPEGQEVFIRSNQTLRETSMEVFDRTFTITVVLRLLAVMVAFIGVLSALMALQLERSRELAVLRAVGLTPRQLWRYVTLQTGLMGLFAGLLAVPLGLVLASVLIYVINKRSFGWTMQLDLSPEILVQPLVLALLAAVLAGTYPARRMARANPAMALREE